MATIVTSYTYTNGNVLTPDSHNRNIASATVGEGIMSEPNGGVGTGNLVAGFRISREHIQIGQAHRGGQEARYETIDILSNAIPSTGGKNIVPIPGLGIRFYLPYNCASVMLQWSFFLSPMRILYSNVNAPATYLTPIIQHVTFVDGVAVPHTLRFVPWTTQFNEPAAPPSRILNMEENRACVQRDMAHMVKNMAQGWHSLSVRVYMERPALTQPGVVDDDMYLNNFRRTINGTPIDSSDHYVHSRLTIGIGNVRYNAFL
jgi:hypothetical protein